MDEAFQNFFEKITEDGFEQFRIWYGQYRGEIIRNDDPDGRGRLQVSVNPMNPPGVAIDVWIENPFLGAGPNRGCFWPGEVGDLVWVRFEHGDPLRPQICLGGIFTTAEGVASVPPEFAYGPGQGEENDAPEVRGFITRMGHRILFSDKKDDEYLRILWHKADPGDEAHTDRSLSADRGSGDTSAILFESNGDVRISNKNGTTIHLDAENGEFKINDENKNLISMDSDGVKIVDGSSGNSFALENGKLTIMCGGEAAVQAPSVQLKCTSTALNNAANQSLVLGEIYTAARALKSSAQIASHTAAAPVWAALSAFATAFAAWVPLLQTDAAITPVMPSFTPGTTLATLAGALVPLCATATAADGAAIGVITGFEGGALSYLSKTTKTT